jgi:hypothetical protein
MRATSPANLISLNLITLVMNAISMDGSGNFGTKIKYASFETFSAVMIQVEVFWVVKSCSVVTGYQRFRGPCCLHLQVSYHNATQCHNPQDLDWKITTPIF